MSYSKSLIIPAVTAALTGYVSAQEVHTEITAWSVEGCNPDPNDTSAFSDRFTIWEGDVRTEIGDEYCTAAQWDVDGWPTDTSGDYIVYVDQSGIEDNCELQFFKIGESDDEQAKTCEFQYSGLTNEAVCARRSLGRRYGYAYCCEDACKLMEAGDVFGVVGASSAKKQRSPEPGMTWPRPISGKKRSGDGALEERAVCKWNGDATVTETYGDQLQVGGTVSCDDPESACGREVSLSYSEMYSNSFEVSTTAGASLFGIISAEVSFSYTYEKATEEGFTDTYQFDVPAGGSGYIGFSPKLNCVNGLFEGDCDWVTGVQGDACFVQMNGAEPMGNWEFISVS